MTPAEVLADRLAAWHGVKPFDAAVMADRLLTTSLDVRVAVGNFAAGRISDETLRLVVKAASSR